jgi:hypothetical protein
VVNVSSEHRLKRLRDLLAQLERLPATAERDRMLREVRARVVDVDTGVPPRAVLPVEPDSVPAADPGSPATRAPGVVAPTPQANAASPARPQFRRPAKPVHVPPGEVGSRGGAELATDGSFTGAGLRLAADVLLSLDDSASFSPSDAQAAPAAAPWRRGLRG